MLTDPDQLTVDARDRRLTLAPSRPLIMGIANASPESFSRDGQTDLARQVAYAEAMIAAGAAVIDVGGESGVTNVAPIDPGEEIRRVVPLVSRLVDTGAVVSVDTWKPAVARAVLQAGAHIINDVSGLRDPALAEACADHGAALVVMHTRAEPKTKTFPEYEDVVEDVISYLSERMALAEQLGVPRGRVIVDPGPDFAKTPAQTIAVLRALPRVAELGRPVLLAVSRKDFVGALTERLPRDRGAGTLAAIGAGVAAGASMVRVHDVAAARDYLAVSAALRGVVEVDPELTLPDDLRREPMTIEP